MLIPRELLQNELKKLDVRRNLILELSSIFWAPKLLVAYQLQNILDARPIQNLDENEPSYKTNRTANLEAH